MSFRSSPLFVLLAFADGLAAQPYILSTYAGRGVTPTPVTATQATIAKPYGIAHAGGKVYFSANHVVYVVDSTGLMKRVAGTGTPGFAGDGGLAVNAKLNFPSGLSADSAGNVYIADTGNFRIRKVTSAGIISTVAGNENGGTPPLTGVATAVPLMPSGVVADASGNFWIADKSGVLKVSASGILTNIYSSGGLSPSLTNYLTTMALDSAGSVYFPLQSGSNVVKITSAGGISLIPAASGSNPGGVAIDSAGSIYISPLNTSQAVRKIDTFGTVTSIFAIRTNTSIAIDSADNLVYARDSTILKETASGRRSTFAGDGSLEGLFAFNTALLPLYLTVDSAGNIYYSELKVSLPSADTYVDTSRVYKISAAGVISLFAGSPPTGFSGDGGLAKQAAFNSIFGVHGNGLNVYIADNGNQRVRKVVQGPVFSTETVTTVAGGGSSEANGVPATTALIQPRSMTVDKSGNLYVTNVYDSKIRKVNASTGLITTFAGGGTSDPGDNGPATSVALGSSDFTPVTDSNGNLYFYQSSPSSLARIRRITPGGIITTVAGSGFSGYTGDGGPAISAQIGYGDVAVEPNGGIIFSDNINSVIRRIDSNGIISTVAGIRNTVGSTGDGGIATSGALQYPGPPFADSAGRIFFKENALQATSTSSVIRVLTPVGTLPVLGVTLSHTGSFAPGQTGTFTITISNAAQAGPTSGAITVRAVLPTGFPVAAMSGSGWNCSGIADPVCTRSDALAGGSSYPDIIFSVNVAGNAPSQLTNQVILSGGGALPTGATDLAAIVVPGSTVPAAPALTAPASNAVGISTSPALVWAPASGADSYDVYFGTASTPPQVTNITAVAYSPGSVAAGTVYYWKIVARNTIGTTSSATQSFTTLGSPATITPANSGQTAIVGTAFALPLQATVKDAAGAPISGVTVTFTAPASGASAAIAITAVTNASGVASVTATANTSAGSYIVTATAGSLTATFTLTNAAVCTSASIAPAAPPIDNTAQILPLTFTVAPANCGWTATTDANWSSLSPALGAGNVTLNFTATANTANAQRAANVTIAGQTFAVTQRRTATVFGDSSPDDFFFDALGLMRSKNITSGCSTTPLLYCPNNNVTRGQMAIFVVRAITGGDTFSFTSTPYFGDVPATHPYFKWIQKMRDLAITAGCGATTYCPDDAVTRGQMAVFIIRARMGASTAFNFPTTPSFTDVAANYPYFQWIQKMKQVGITGGCSATTYCPGDPVTRGQMAIFIERGAFNELLAAGTPVVSTVTLPSGSRGTTVTVTLAGTATNFAQGTTLVTAGAGITVGTVAVTGPTTLSAQFAIAAGAEPGQRSIVVTTGAEEAVAPNAFTIQ